MKVIQKNKHASCSAFLPPEPYWHYLCDAQRYATMKGDYKRRDALHMKAPDNELITKPFPRPSVSRNLFDLHFKSTVVFASTRNLFFYFIQSTNCSSDTPTYFLSELEYIQILWIPTCSSIYSQFQSLLYCLSSTPKPIWELRQKHSDSDSKLSYFSLYLYGKFAWPLQGRKKSIQW